jgi:hypothetical protein
MLWIDMAVVVVSKTFTTAETMLNARTLRAWITSALGQVDVPFCALFIFSNLNYQLFYFSALLNWGGSTY